MNKVTRFPNAPVENMFLKATRRFQDFTSQRYFNELYRITLRYAFWLFVLLWGEPDLLTSIRIFFFGSGS